MLTRVLAVSAAGPPQGAAAEQVSRREVAVEAAAVGAVTHIRQAELQCWQQGQRRIQAGAKAGQKEESLCESKVWR